MWPGFRRVSTWFSEQVLAISMGTCNKFSTIQGFDDVITKININYQFRR